MKAAVQIRQGGGWPHEEVRRGLLAVGIEPVFTSGPIPDDCDLVVSWNDYGNRAARAAEAVKRGARHLILENGPRIQPYTYIIQVGGHNGPQFLRPDGGGFRSEQMIERLRPWRPFGGDRALICGQRGGSYSDLAMPREWPAEVASDLIALGTRSIRFRRHPEREIARRALPPLVRETDHTQPLAYDLVDSDFVVVWTSMSAIIALLQGVPAVYQGPRHVAEELLVDRLEEAFLPPKPDRRPFFARLAWNLWSGDEIATGEAFRAYV